MPIRPIPSAPSLETKLADVVALLDGVQAPDAQLGVALEDHGAANPAVPRNCQLFGPRMT